MRHIAAHFMGLPMTRSADGARLARVELLASRLKSDEAMSVGALAAELGLSRRTVTRDIALLRDRGLPVDADRGRGGGVRVSSSWGVGRLNLSYREAVDLLVSLAVAEQAKSPILIANLAPIRRKLMASFSAPTRGRINQLKARLLIGEPASISVLASHAVPSTRVVESLHEAFLMMQAARIVYQDGAGKRTTREIEPHYLLLNYPIWYVLAYDFMRDSLRTFRCDRLISVEPLGNRFELRHLDQFRAGLEGADIIMP
jgi:predicted DNA-binding transcriptional regulator YafY